MLAVFVLILGAFVIVLGLRVMFLIAENDGLRKELREVKFLCHEMREALDNDHHYLTRIK